MLDPKSQKVFVKKGEKSVYNIIQNDDNECLTTLFVASASGQLAPPLVIFSYKRVPNSIRENMPEGWAAGKSDNGWMNGENFYEYIANIFYPWLVENKVKFPVILYIDGHSSHLTMAVSDFCREKQIVLIALHPNATHILQPLDVAFFHPLKVAWRKVVTDWRMNNNGNKITKENFTTLLKSAVDTLDIRSIMKNAFKTTGLHPFSADAINYNKLRNKTKGNEEQDNASPQSEDHHALTAMEKYIDPVTLRKFEEVDDDEEWDGDLKDSSLFMVWKSMKSNFFSFILF
ncbi:GSCOCG00011304001-RA-CDS [Cotesia congregata]|nr:GSCOCG00011304001-RA-CDS [Cotesia congregata]